MTLHDVVSHYILNCRYGLAKEMRAFTAHCSFEKAIERAALSRLPDGKHKHQQRIAPSTLAKAGKRLQEKQNDMKKCNSFLELHSLVSSIIRPIHGIGELAIYDISHRIGAKLLLKPEIVFLHAGAAKGAQCLGFNSRRKTLLVKDLPEPFHSLSPAEAEDCLCIYKNFIQSIVQGSTPESNKVQCRINSCHRVEYRSTTKCSRAEAPLD